MLPGFALEQTWTGTPDFPGHEVVTVSPGGPGRMVPCLKCNQCGHSETVEPCTQEDRDKILAAAQKRVFQLYTLADELEVYGNALWIPTGPREAMLDAAGQLRQLAGATE